MIQIRKQNTKSTAVKAGIAGAVIGAAGAAIGIAMSDQKNRQKVKKSLDDAKQWTEDKVSAAKKNTDNLKDDVKKVKSKSDTPEKLK